MCLGYSSDDSVLIDRDVLYAVGGRTAKYTIHSPFYLSGYLHGSLTTGLSSTCRPIVRVDI